MKQCRVKDRTKGRIEGHLLGLDDWVPLKNLLGEGGEDGIKWHLYLPIKEVYSMFPFHPFSSVLLLTICSHNHFDLSHTLFNVANNPLSILLLSLHLQLFPLPLICSVLLHFSSFLLWIKVVSVCRQVFKREVRCRTMLGLEKMRLAKFPQTDRQTDRNLSP